MINGECVTWDELRYMLKEKGGRISRPHCFWGNKHKIYTFLLCIRKRYGIKRLPEYLVESMCRIFFYPINLRRQLKQIKHTVLHVFVDPQKSPFRRCKDRQLISLAIKSSMYMATVTRTGKLRQPSYYLKRIEFRFGKQTRDYIVWGLKINNRDYLSVARVLVEQWLQEK